MSTRKRAHETDSAHETMIQDDASSDSDQCDEHALDDAPRTRIVPLYALVDRHAASLRSVPAPLPCMVCDATGRVRVDTDDLHAVQCFACGGTRTLDAQRYALHAAMREAFCRCEQAGDWRYYEARTHRRCVAAEHLHCERCGLLAQISQ